MRIYIYIHYMGAAAYYNKSDDDDDNNDNDIIISISSINMYTTKYNNNDDNNNNNNNNNIWPLSMPIFRGNNYSGAFHPYIVILLLLLYIPARAYYVAAFHANIQGE